MMTEDEVLWGAALMLMRRHGDAAPVKVAEHIGELALDGDEVGRAVWVKIAYRMDQLMREGSIN
jgi:hypothetical protein